MDAEKSSNSSFEDLSNLNEAEIKTTVCHDVGTSTNTFVDDEGNIESQSTTSLDSENSNFIAKTSFTSMGSMSDKVKAATTQLIGTEGGESNMKSNADNIMHAEQKPSEAFIASEGGTKITAAASTPESPTVSSSQSPSSMDDQLPEENILDEAEVESADDDLVCDVLGNGQLVKTVIKKSKLQRRPKRGDLVTVTYVGKLPDGTIVDEAKNLQLHVGDYEVVQGLDMVIPLMDLNEVAQVKVDARFAYGSLGLKHETDPSKTIPSCITVTYVIEVLDIKVEDFSDLKTFDVRRKYGTRKKERANFWYNRSEYNIAIQLYRRALDYLDDRDGDPDAAFEKEDIELSNSDLQALLEDRLIVYNNMAMAQIKISAFDAALKSVENVLRCQPTNSKALYRKGRILEGKGDVKGAISLLQKAATLEPDSKIIQQDLAKLIIKARREEHNEKELYQKMLGQAKKLEMKNKQPQKQETTPNSKAKLLGYLMGSILIGVAGVAIYRYKY